MAINDALQAKLSLATDKYQALQKKIARMGQQADSAGDKNNGNDNGKVRQFPLTRGQGRQLQQANAPINHYQIKEDKIDLAKPAVQHRMRANKRPDNYVAAGSYATAVLLGGADAAAGATSQADPKPVLMKVVSDGVLPNNQRSHLKGCLVTAAVVGDISAERGAIRLERLSCTKPKGQIIDIAVKGTIFGHDGKNGVRGNPVWREGPLMARAGMAGFFQGLGHGLETRLTPQAALVSSGNQVPQTKQMLGAGLGKGIGNAFDKIADYNIKRADQYHPIIQISAGQKVDIVFLQGFYIDGLSHDGDASATSEEVVEEKSSTDPRQAADQLLRGLPSHAS